MTKITNIEQFPKPKHEIVQRTYTGGQTIHTSNIHILDPKDKMGGNNPYVIDPLLYNLLSIKTPHGHEMDLVGLMPKSVKGMQRSIDQQGNITYLIGKVKEHRTMFSCHMDTVHKDPGKIDLCMNESGMVFGVTPSVEGKWSPSILGADDKVGMYIMLCLMKAKVPGMYVFHVGEEWGGIGSSYKVTTEPAMFANVDRCIAFDRANYGNIINEQGGDTCCSTEFAQELAKQISQNLSDPLLDDLFKPDPTGTFTDSANYVNLIPECTNVSVGYFRQHQSVEHFDWPWLSDQLIPALIKVKWSELPVKRQRGYSKYGGFNSTPKHDKGKGGGTRHNNTNWSQTAGSGHNSTTHNTIKADASPEDIKKLFAGTEVNLSALRSKALDQMPEFTTALLCQVATSNLTDSDKKETLKRLTKSAVLQGGSANIEDMIPTLAMGFVQAMGELNKMQVHAVKLADELAAAAVNKKEAEDHKRNSDFWQDAFNSIMDGNVSQTAVDLQLDDIMDDTMNDLEDFDKEKATLTELQNKSPEELVDMVTDLQDILDEVSSNWAALQKGLEGSNCSLQDIQTWGTTDAKKVN